MSLLLRNHRQISCLLRSNITRLQRPISAIEKLQMRQFSNQELSWFQRKYDKCRVFFATHFRIGERNMSNKFTVSISILTAFAFALQVYAVVVLDCFGSPMDVNRLPEKNSQLEVEKPKRDLIVSK